MANDALNWAWGVPCTPTQKLVLVALADHADEHGRCFPSVGRIAERCCLTRRAVQKAVAAMSSLGLVEMTNPPGSRHVFTLRTSFTPEPRSPVNNVHTTPEPRSQEGANHVREGGEPRSPKPSRNHQVTLIEPSPREDGFDEFWLLYPKKASKQQARKAWDKLAPCARLRTEILADVKQRSQSPDWTKEGGQFVPHPATYLRNERWTDAKPASVATAPNQPARQEAEAAFASRLLLEAQG